MSQQDYVSETTHTGWIQRLMGAIVGVVIGIVLIPLTGIGIFWNEGRAVQTARSLAEGMSAVIDVDAGRVDAANEGRLVHVQGDLKTGKPLSDPTFMVDARVVRLVRRAEMYQWQEESHTETRKTVGGGEDKTTTYSYIHVWSDHRIDSGRFHAPANHGNPQPRFGNFQVTADDATLGAFRPGRQVLDELPAGNPLPLTPGLADRLHDRMPQSPVSVSDGRLFFGAAPAAPQVGDMRIGYLTTPTGPVTLVGRQSGSDITPYQTKAGDTVLMAEAGQVPAATLFKSAEDTNRTLTWVVRVVCVVLLWVGFFLILRPIAVMGDVVPLLGGLLDAGAGLVSLLLSLLVAPVLIALAWFVYRPVVAAITLVAGLALAAGIYGLVRRRRRRKAVRFLPQGVTG